jgi:hypothetical protein
VDQWWDPAEKRIGDDWRAFVFATVVFDFGFIYDLLDECQWERWLLGRYAPCFSDGGH